MPSPEPCTLRLILAMCIVDAEQCGLFSYDVIARTWKTDKGLSRVNNILEILSSDQLRSAFGV